MFDLEMVQKEIPFETKFGQKFLVQDNVGLRTFLVQDKVGLRTFSPKFFFAKSLKMSCLMEKW